MKLSGALLQQSTHTHTRTHLKNNLYITESQLQLKTNIGDDNQSKSENEFFTS